MPLTEEELIHEEARARSNREVANAEFQEQTPEEAKYEKKITAEIETGGSLIEAVAGGGAIVLSILGLVGILTTYMVTISTIAIGGGLLIEGASVAARFRRLLAQLGGGGLGKMELGGGMTAEFLGGATGILLGLLGLLGVMPNLLVSVAIIVFGGSLVLGSGVTARLSNLMIETSGEHALAQRVAREAVEASAGVQVFVGLGAIVLGILSLVNIQHMTLNLVATLALGAAIFFGGATLSGKMISIFSTGKKI